jgi:hypothetical protein
VGVEVGGLWPWGWWISGDHSYVVFWRFQVGFVWALLVCLGFLLSMPSFCLLDRSFAWFFTFFCGLGYEYL